MNSPYYFLENALRTLIFTNFHEKCDGIQLTDHYPCLVLTGKSSHLIKSDLQYQGYLSKHQAETISEEELQQLALNHGAKLHLHKDYNYVEYYEIIDLSRDAFHKLLDSLDTLEELTHTEIELWSPHCIKYYQHSFCIKGFTQDSVNKVLEELDRIKQSALRRSEEPEVPKEPEHWL